MAGRNRRSGADLVCFAGAGAYDHEIPAAVRRLAFRSEFVTAYTPYQPEVAQGVLQALFEYQTLLCRLSGVEVANASLYDGASACVEAVNLAVTAAGRQTVWVSEGVHPHWRDVVRTFAAGTGHDLVSVPLRNGVTELPADESSGAPAAILVQHPNYLGCLEDLTAAVNEDGLLTLLEIADVTEAGQDAGVDLALQLGVDIIVGTWRPESAAVIESVKQSAYFPFLGSLSGSPLQLQGSPADLAAQMSELAANAGVAGAVLMPYRQKEHSPDELMPSVIRAADLPILIAGGVESSEQIMAIDRAGAWGFTMGAGALKLRHEDAGSVRRKVLETLSLCQSLESASPGYRTRVVY